MQPQCSYYRILECFELGGTSETVIKSISLQFSSEQKCEHPVAFPNSQLGEHTSSAASSLQFCRRGCILHYPSCKAPWAVQTAPSPSTMQLGAGQIKHACLLRKTYYFRWMLMQEGEILKRQEILKQKCPWHSHFSCPFICGSSHRLSSFPRSLTLTGTQTAMESGRDRAKLIMQCQFLPADEAKVSVQGQAAQYL